LKILAYVPAGFTVIARTYVDAHWTSDEVFGAAIGLFTARWVVGLHEPTKARVQLVSVYPPLLSIAF
jgi:hypothetical protein